MGSRWQPSSAIALVLNLISVHAAMASQGPGGGHGAASAAMQLLMAIAVYGSVAVILAAGLIGSFKRRFWASS